MNFENATDMRDALAFLCGSLKNMVKTANWTVGISTYRDAVLRKYEKYEIAETCLCDYFLEIYEPQDQEFALIPLKNTETHQFCICVIKNSTTYQLFETSSKESIHEFSIHIHEYIDCHINKTLNNHKTILAG